MTVWSSWLPRCDKASRCSVKSNFWTKLVENFCERRRRACLGFRRLTVSETLNPTKKFLIRYFDAWAQFWQGFGEASAKKLRRGFGDFSEASARFRQGFREASARLRRDFGEASARLWRRFDEASARFQRDIDEN